MRSGLEGDTVLDAGVLVELVAGTKLGRKMASLLKENSVRALTTELNIAELRYVICRKVGWEKSREIVDGLLRSGYIKAIWGDEISKRAAALKCKRALSLVDSFTIAAGEVLGAKVMFARREKSSKPSSKKNPLTLPLYLRKTCWITRKAIHIARNNLRWRESFRDSTYLKIWFSLKSICR